MAPTPIPALNRLIAGAQTFEGRLVLTAALLLVLVGVGWFARRVRRRIEIESENVERVLNAGLALGLFVIALIVGTSLLSLWGISPFEFLGIDEPVVLVGRLMFTVATLLGVYVLTGVIKRIVHEFTDDREAITRHQTELAFRSTQVALYVLGGIVLLGIWGADPGGLLVGAGFLGIVVGLAARQTLGSLIAGFVLMFARPFEVGDWVEIGDREGIVTEISIVNTRIQTPDGEYVMLPNDLVSSNEIVNRSRKGRLRIRVAVGVDYGADVEHAISVAQTAIKEVEDVLTVPQPQVVVTGFGASSIDLEARFWIDRPSARRRSRARSAVVTAVKTAFDREGIKIPFPQRELMGRAEEGGFRLSQEERAVETADHTPDGNG